jgi:hypothetical protein
MKFLSDKLKNSSIKSPQACSLPMHQGHCVGVGTASEHLRNLSEWLRERQQTESMQKEGIDGEYIFDVIGKAGEDFRSFVLNDANHPECS